MSKYLVVSNKDVIAIFDEFDESLSYFLDIMIHDLRILIDTQKLNEKIKIPEYIYKILHLKSNVVKEDLIEYNIIYNEIESIESFNKFLDKVNKIKSFQNDLLKSKLYNEIINEFSNEIFDNTPIKSRDVNLINLSSDSDTESESLELYSTQSDSDDQKEMLELQLKRIQELERKKNEIDNKNNKKKEKDEEITRRFEVDYNLYLKLSDSFKNEIPELFKNQYPVFKEMQTKDIINDKEKSKEYYKLNYNRINKNIGSNIFLNIFNQEEPEEKKENNNLIDSDDTINKNNIESEEILYA